MSKRAKIVKGGLVFALLFCLFFGLLIQFVNDPFFDTDEGDIYSRGSAIAMGYDLYSEVSSQHMPFTYYFSALFWALGAQSVTAQRIAFYILFAVLWCGIYFRYKSDVGKTALIAYPVLFTIAVCLYDYGTAILSEHLAGIGFVILALEFLRFCKTRTIERDSCIAISFAIVLTFGTIFVAAYGVATVAVFVLVKEVQWLVSEHQSFKLWLKNGVLLFLKLAFWCLLPWAVLMVIYAINGNLGDAIYYAYTFNRTVYAKYTGGYGADAVEGALSGLTYLKNMVTGFLGGNLSLVSWAEIGVCCLALMGIVWHAMKRQVAEAMFFATLIIALATRGIWTFHGTQCVAILCFLAAMAVSYIVHEPMGGMSHVVSGTILVVCIGITAITYCNSFALNIETSEGKTADAKVLDAITEDGEAIFSTGGSTSKSLIQAKVVFYKGVGSPWFADARAEEIIASYPDGVTRVALYGENIVVWSKQIKDYAPELCEYMEKNYTKLYSHIHVRNDEYEEATKKLEANAIPYYSFEPVPEEDKLIVTLSRPSEEKQGVSFGVWSESSGQDDLIWYGAKRNEDGKYVVEVNLADHLLGAQKGQINVYAIDGYEFIVWDWYYATLATP